jgi:hypothetical protein
MHVGGKMYDNVNINLKNEYKRLKIFTITMALEAELPTILILDPQNDLLWKSISSLLYIPAILMIVSYKYNKNIIKHKISDYNNIYEKTIKNRELYFTIPALIYFMISPISFIITKNIIFLIVYDLIGFFIFILDIIIINKRDFEGYVLNK